MSNTMDIKEISVEFIADVTTDFNLMDLYNKELFSLNYNKEMVDRFEMFVNTENENFVLISFNLFFIQPYPLSLVEDLIKSLTFDSNVEHLGLIKYLDFQFKTIF